MPPTQHILQSQKDTLNVFLSLPGQSVSYDILEFLAGSLIPVHLHPRAS